MRQLANTFQDIQDLVNERELDASKQGTVVQKSQNWGALVLDLDAVVTKYNNLRLQSGRTWERLTWKQKEGQEIRTRVTHAVNDVQVFYDGLSQDPMAYIGQALEQLAAAIKNSRLDPATVVTVGTSEKPLADTSVDDPGWS